jgi:hypothetical protein
MLGSEMSGVFCLFEPRYLMNDVHGWLDVLWLRGQSFVTGIRFLISFVSDCFWERESLQVYK